MQRSSEVTRLMGGGSGFTSANGPGFLACSTSRAGGIDWPPTWHGSSARLPASRPLQRDLVRQKSAALGMFTAATQIQENRLL